MLPHLISEGLVISARLCKSPCRSDYLIPFLVRRVRRIVSEDSQAFRLSLSC